jgi:hypothetical protein
VIDDISAMAQDLIDVLQAHAATQIKLGAPPKRRGLASKHINTRRPSSNSTRGGRCKTLRNLTEPLQLDAAKQIEAPSQTNSPVTRSTGRRPTDKMVFYARQFASRIALARNRTQNAIVAAKARRFARKHSRRQLRQQGADPRFWMPMLKKAEPGIVPSGLVGRFSDFERGRSDRAI